MTITLESIDVALLAILIPSVVVAAYGIGWFAGFDKATSILDEFKEEITGTLVMIRKEIGG